MNYTRGFNEAIIKHFCKISSQDFRNIKISRFACRFFCVSSWAFAYMYIRGQKRAGNFSSPDIANAFMEPSVNKIFLRRYDTIKNLSMKFL